MTEQATQEQAEAAKVPAKLTEWEWETALGAVKLSVDTVRKYFCAKATEPEVMHFLAVCKYHRLNPWLREAYLIKYQDGEAAQIVIGRDTHARRAEDHPQYAGDEGGIIVRREDGTIEERQGEFYLEPEKLVGGWAKIYRKDRPEKPVIHRVRLQDWDRGRAFWKSSPSHMIAKVARAQARHEAFPTEFAGIYSEDEAEAGRQAMTAPTIDMPMSNAEAKALNGAPPAEMPCQTEQVPVPAPTVSDAQAEDEAEDERLTAELAAEARAREQAEAQPDPPKVVGKVDRGMIFNAVLRRAKRESKQAATVLRELTAKSNMSDLSDEECLALAKKLQG